MFMIIVFLRNTTTCLRCTAKLDAFMTEMEEKFASVRKEIEKRNHNARCAVDADDSIQDIVEQPKSDQPNAKKRVPAEQDLIGAPPAKRQKLDVLQEIEKKAEEQTDEKDTAKQLEQEETNKNKQSELEATK